MKKTLLAVAVGGVCLNTYAQETLSLEDLWELIQEQQAQIESLEKDLEESNSQIKETNVIATSVADAVESGAMGGGDSLSASWADKTSLGGYGEHHYNIVDEGRDQIDAHRYVLYVAHEYTDSVRFFSEWELEHSLAGEGKPGEVELEQAFIEWQFSRNNNLKFGQFLIPVGILNETHEPDTFYGVERNKVEAEVIPATWWETGVMLSGNLSESFSYDVAVHSGLNLADEDTNTIETFRIRSARQKSAEANGNNLAFTSRLSFVPAPGFSMGVTAQYQTDMLQGVVPGEDASALLLEANAVYQSENFGVRALYSAWDIDNDNFETAGADDPSGWYIEPSYKLTESLGIFARYSEVDPSRGDRPTEKTELIDVGFNYWLNPQVVLKADYQDSQEDGSDSFNLGVGWSY